MPAGRPRIATKLHLLHGNPGGHPHSLENEPQPELIAPQCPEILSAEARAEWDRLATELEALGLLTRLDRANMTGYCQSWADYLEAQRHLDNEPKVFKTATGYPLMTPWKTYRDIALTEMRKFGTELGLSAPSRTRINVKPIEKINPKSIKRFLA
jgi:P27 family predicted phage terminase small subunit